MSNKQAKAHAGNIKDSRQRLGLTQAQLAYELDWSTQQVSNLETGERDVQKQTRLAIECLLRRKNLWVEE